MYASKTHFTAQTGSACGRPAKRTTTNTHAVTCQVCKGQPEFKQAAAEAGIAAAEAFANQVPTTVRSPWGNGDITCKCGHNLFRSNGRSMDYYRHVCAACGETTMTLTETGMCR